MTAYRVFLRIMDVDARSSISMRNLRPRPDLGQPEDKDRPLRMIHLISAVVF